MWKNNIVCVFYFNYAIPAFCRVHKFTISWCNSWINIDSHRKEKRTLLIVSYVKRHRVVYRGWKSFHPVDKARNRIHMRASMIRECSSTSNADKAGHSDEVSCLKRIVVYCFQITSKFIYPVWCTEIERAYLVITSYELFQFASHLNVILFTWMMYQYESLI